MKGFVWPEPLGYTENQLARNQLAKEQPQTCRDTTQGAQQSKTWRRSGKAGPPDPSQRKPQQVPKPLPLHTQPQLQKGHQGDSWRWPRTIR